MLTEGTTNGSHQRESIIGTLCQSSGGPIAFASVTYLFIFPSLRKICQFPERLMNENIDEKDRKNVCLQTSIFLLVYRVFDFKLRGTIAQNRFSYFHVHSQAPRNAQI